MINSVEACENYDKKHEKRCFVIISNGFELKRRLYSIISGDTTPEYLIDFIEEKSLWWRKMEELKETIDEISDIKEQHEKEVRAFFEGLE